jgi:hypothetical protein
MTIPIRTIMSAIDNGDKDFYDRITPEQRKEIVPFVLLQWVANVADQPHDQISEIQEYYLKMVNKNVNLHFFDIQKDHPRLIWRLLCGCAMTDAIELKREWFTTKKITSGSSNHNKTAKFLRSRFPELNDEEIETMIMKNDSKTIKAYATDCGLSPADIKKQL